MWACDCTILRRPAPGLDATVLAQLVFFTPHIMSFALGVSTILEQYRDLLAGEYDDQRDHDARIHAYAMVIFTFGLGRFLWEERPRGWKHLLAGLLAVFFVATYPSLVDYCELR
jgi:hypothetical protein